MSFFPFMVAGLLAVVVAMWTNLDFLNEKLVGEKPPHCLPPYEVEWIPWEPGLVEKKRSEGEVVFLLFKVDWDLTSMVNEKRLFNSDAFVGKLEEYRVVLIKADFTDQDPKIRDELVKYGGMILPKSVIFSSDMRGEPIILPELLTPEIVIEGLNRAAGK
ncbi:MAG: hypothetical protein ABF381_00745 [Akkermansiaceae bacterium]